MANDNRSLPQAIEAMLVECGYSAQEKPVLHDLLKNAFVMPGDLKDGASKRKWRVETEKTLASIQNLFEMACKYHTPYYAKPADISEAFLCAAAMRYLPEDPEVPNEPLVMKLPTPLAAHEEALMYAWEIQFNADIVLLGWMNWEETTSWLSPDERMLMELRLFMKAEAILRELNFCAVMESSLFMPAPAVIANIKGWRPRLAGHESALASAFLETVALIEAETRAPGIPAAGADIVTLGHGGPRTP